jgi:aminoglycoside phosphotransferase family enzyme/predicted kinase
MAGTRPAVAETHVSVLFFLGDRAYKLRKAVKLGFVDFSTRESRLADCRREIGLNRRLAPDVYLGILDLVGEDGRACDHLVVMRRLPEERRLARLVKSRQEVEPCLGEVARQLADFHASAARSPEIDSAATAEAVGRNWEDNLAQMRPFVGSILDETVASRVADLARRFLEGRGPLFDVRIAQSRACDGHGDLRAEDIFCLEDGPRILDCVEFDDRLRYGDVLADIAFLAMDLESLGASGPASSFLARYRQLSGDTWPASLAHHYCAYRAHVRAKVACILHGENRDPAVAKEAGSLLALARAHLEGGRVRLVLVGGLPGTGKSTLATALGQARGWPVLRSDEVRKELAGLPATAAAEAPYRKGLYTSAATAATYDELLRRAVVALGMGQSVVLDASWTSEDTRRQAARAVAATSSDLVQLRCEAPPGVATARLARRRASRTDISDADAPVAEAMRRAADPWPSATAIDCSEPPEACLNQVLAIVGK